MSETPKKFYLTTPIYYVNARPHIGHAYSTIAADVIARRHRLLGDDTFFLTGTDEHGQKVQRSAEKAAIPPQQFADEVSATFRDLWKRMGITNDDYIRTTDERHKRGVQKLWRTLEERGAIYLSTYTGQYSVGEEMFVEGPPGTIGPDGKPTETVTEENYFFKLSEYQQPIIDLIESNQLHIQPEAIRNEVLSFLRGNFAAVLTEVYDRQPPRLDAVSPEKIAENEGRIDTSASGHNYVPGALKDLSISRTTFDWGIPVPPQASATGSGGHAPAADPEGHAFRRADEIRAEGASALPKAVLARSAPKPDQSHVIYVWLDALANYITAIGYGSDDPADIAKFEKYWPADLHLVGKEIIRFHCVYWPAFLLALNPALDGHKPSDVPFEVHAAWAEKMVPKSVVANGWLLFEESKMSKSRGNVVRTETILDAFGPLCPPVPSSLSTSTPAPAPPPAPPPAPASEGVILSEARSAQSKDPEALDTTTSDRPILPQNPAAPGSSSGLQPAVPASEGEGASAPGSSLTSPTEAQQDLFASDVIRYFLLREIPFGQDGSFSFDALITRYNADLANGYGNLVSRTLAMIEKYFDGVVPSPLGTEQERLQSVVAGVVAHDRNPLNDFDLTDLVEAIWGMLASTDAYITRMAPWKLASDRAKRNDLADVLYNSAEFIRVYTTLIYPFMPYATASVWAQLGLGSIEEAARNGELKNLQWGGLKPGTKLGPLAPIFPRADKGLAQIMNDMESANAAPADLPKSPKPILIECVTDASPESLANVTSKSSPSTTPSTTAPQSEQSVSSALSSPPEAPPTPEITIDDFVKIDLRVAQIVVAERIPKADKLLRLEVDLGPLGRRQILSGIAEFYTPEELIGRRIAVISNLAPRKMRGLESHGMLLAASGDDHATKPILATFSDEVPLGSRIR
jgi:methionyl-tRNA synthetase